MNENKYLALQNAKKLEKQIIDRIRTTKDKIEAFKSRKGDLEKDIQKINYEKDKVESATTFMSMGAGVIGGGLSSAVLTRNPYAAALGAYKGADRAREISQSIFSAQNAKVERMEQEVKEIDNDIRSLENYLTNELEKSLYKAQDLIRDAEYGR